MSQGSNANVPHIPFPIALVLIKGTIAIYLIDNTTEQNWPNVTFL